MQTIKILFFSFFLIGCAIKKKGIYNFSNKSEEFIKAKIGSVDEYSDSFAINSLEIDGNYLLLQIAYEGGCEKHDFQFIGSRAISKSLPPIRSVQLIHTSNLDTCKKKIEQNLVIDITELSYMKEKGSKIYFTLIGWDKKIEYVFE